MGVFENMSRAWAQTRTSETDKTQALVQAFGAVDLTTSEMQQSIAEWFALFFRRAPDRLEDPCLQLPYAIVHKLQKTVFSEYSSAVMPTGSIGKAAWMDVNRRAVEKIKKQALQWALVGGACLIKPIPDQEHFHFSAIRRDAYAVLGRGPDGRLTDLLLAEYCETGKYIYALGERRTATATGLAIEYRLYQSDSRRALGKRVPLGTLPLYAQLQDSLVLPGVQGVGLAELRMPMANAIDGSADGMCVYAPAVGLIHNANRNERLLVDEFEHGRSRVFASTDVLVTDEDGRRALVDDVFAGLDASARDVGVTVYSPALRGDAYETRKQGYLKAAENIIGLKRGILSDVEAAERTATEITSSAGDYNLTIVDIQNAWFDALREALVLTDEVGRAYRLCDATEWDAEALTVTWGNGVLYDARQEWQDDLQAVQAKLLRPEIALAHWYDLPCDTPEELAAIREKYMPEISSLLE